MTIKPIHLLKWPNGKLLHMLQNDAIKKGEDPSTHMHMYVASVHANERVLKYSTIQYPYPYINPLYHGVDMRVLYMWENMPYP